MKVCLISLDDTYGNVAGLAAAFSRYADTTLVLGTVSKKQMTVQFPGFKRGFVHIPYLHGTTLRKEQGPLQ
jgi:hypothetical protein